jgi:iron complex transport system substrate-binding protein
MRIASLLPSATEIVGALGLADQLVGISHECDYPPAVVAGKPILTRSAIPASLSQEEIDAMVTARLGRGESLYLLDEALLEELAPDVILSQELCDVCAVSSSTVRAAVCRLSSDPRVVSLEPSSIAGILDNIRTVGDIAGVPARAEKLITVLNQRLRSVEEKTQHVVTRPRVFAMEWLTPPYNAGHWVPEMVARAGGIEVLGNNGKPSVRLRWEQITAAQPEVVLLIPCSYDVERTQRELDTISFPDAWRDLPAVHDGNVFALNGPAYFSRPGPRVIDGVQVLAGLFHPESFPTPTPEDARRVELTHAVA